MKKFKVVSNHEISVDHFEDGEGNNVNNFSLSNEVEAADYKQAVGLHLQAFGYNLDFKNCELGLYNNLQTSCLVDGGNYQPTAKDVEMWKNGKLVLYADNISISVFELVEVKF